MQDVWLGWCDQNERDELRRSLRTIDERASLTFVDSAQEMRQRLLEGDSGMGAIVGTATGGLSAVNVAAALAKDDMAAQVALVVHGLTEELSRRAQKAGIGAVIDADALAAEQPIDLDEPALVEDDLPTMVVGLGPSAPAVARRIPEVMPLAPSSGEGGARRGAAVLPAPDAASLAEAASPVPTRPLRRDGAAGAATDPAKGVLEDKAAPIITLVSGRGGVGKTAVVAAMGQAAASWGMSVALCDLDLTCGNLYSCFGLRGPADLAPLADRDLPSPEEVMACGTTISERLTLWGACELPEMAEAVTPRIDRVLSVLASRHDLVLVDTSAAFTDAVAQAVQRCARLVVVVDDRPGSSVAQRRLGSLAVRLGVARTRMVRLANRCGPRGRGEPVINRADVGLETARPLRVLDGGAEVAECLSAGRPHELFELGSRFADSAANSLATMLSELGCLPQNDEARHALSSSAERPRWSFGRRREVG